MGREAYWSCRAVSRISIGRNPASMLRRSVRSGRWAWPTSTQPATRETTLRLLRARVTADAVLPTYQSHQISWGLDHIQIGVVYEPSTSRAENLSDAAARWLDRRAFSHRRRHRAIGSLLRKGLRRSHSEPG